jgi:hypothetical protein
MKKSIEEQIYECIGSGYGFNGSKEDALTLIHEIIEENKYAPIREIGQRQFTDEDIASIRNILGEMWDKDLPKQKVNDYVHGIGEILDSKTLSTPKEEVKELPGEMQILDRFINEIKSEFKDQNWDYLDFIKDRVIDSLSPDPSNTIEIDGEVTATLGNRVRILKSALDTILFESKEPHIKVYAQSALDQTNDYVPKQDPQSHCKEHNWYGQFKEICPLCSPKLTVIKEKDSKGEELVEALRETDAVEFGEWLRTFSALTRVNGYWCLESQIETSRLYIHFLDWKKSQNK